MKALQHHLHPSVGRGAGVVLECLNRATLDRCPCPSTVLTCIITQPCTFCCTEHCLKVEWGFAVFVLGFDIKA